MKKAKIISILTVLFILLNFLLNFGAVATEPEVFTYSETVSASETILDSDPTDGYDGDYLFVYNKSLNYTTGQSVGNISSNTVLSKTNQIFISEEDKYYKRDFHIKPKIKNIDSSLRKNISDISKIFAVGQTKNFKIYTNLQTMTVGYRTFTLKAVGTNCYVWADSNNTYPINETMATIIANEFDNKSALIIDNFGGFYDPTEENKVNILLHNINCGFNPPYQNYYIGGYFDPADLVTVAEEGSGNVAPIINIDTYPSIYRYGGGINYNEIKSTVTHEFQHLINFSQFYTNPNSFDNKNWTEVWLDEAMSMAAEELAYPNNAIIDRVENYNSANNVSQSLYSFKIDNNLMGYSLSALFGQYLRLHGGGYGVFKKISEFYQTQPNATEKNAIEYAVIGTELEGIPFEDIVKNFFLALFINDDTGLYGFKEEPFADRINKKITTLKSTIVGGEALIINSNGNFVPSGNIGNDIGYIGITFGTEEKTLSFDYTIQENNTILIKKNTGNADVINIPSKINEKNVTRIGDHAFASIYNTTDIELIVIPDTVTTIDLYAFINDKINRIQIPQTTVSMENCGMDTSTTIYGYTYSYAYDYALKKGNRFISLGNVDIMVSSIVLNKTNAEMLIDEKTSLTTTVYPQNVINKTAKFSSNNPSVATVNSETGFINAIKAGTARITVIVGGTSVYCDVIVSNYITSSQLTINLTNNTINNIAINQTVGQVRAKINRSQNIKIYSTQNVELSDSEIVGTNMIVKYVDGVTVKYSVIIIIKGDINGDRKGDALDLLQLKKHLLGQVTISGNNALAADVNGDGRLDALDLLQIKKYLLGQITL